MQRTFFETPRLILREWQESDYEPFISLNADPQVMEYFTSVRTKDETIAQIARIVTHIEKNGFGFFAMERKDSGEFIGFTGLANTPFESWFTPCVEIGWRLSRANWGYGFATEAAEACLEFGFNELDIDEIYSFTSIHNIRSEQVMKKIGMVKKGVFDHPLIADGDFLKEHVLYKISRADGE